MIKFDFSNFCEDGKKIILEGIVANEIRFTDIIDHSRYCPVCQKITDDFFNRMVGAIPATFQPFVRSMMKSIGG